MKIQNLSEILRPVSHEQLKVLPRRDLEALYLGEQDIRAQLETFIKVLEEENYLVGEKYVRIKSKLFSPSTEKLPRDKKNGGKKKKDGKKTPDDRTLQLSDRYPKAPIIEQDIEIIPPPPCACCGNQMTDSGMTETTEVLSIIPKKYLIKRQIYHKYNCKACHESIVTSPTLPRIKPGSSYDDDFIIDVSVSKYCDLIPIERYASIAKRQGFPGLPPHSLIELTHYLASFLNVVYEMIKKEVLSAEVLYADETPHRMLEGDEKKNWFLWGFSSETASYFECHNTRSGSIASEILLAANCKHLVSDVYSGYNKAVRECNEIRVFNGIAPVENSYCNAHARRKFKELPGEDGVIFLEKYGEIYEIEREISNCFPEYRLNERQKRSAPIFEEIKTQATELLKTVSNKSHQAQAANYFLKNYTGLSQFLKNGALPIDNNHQERQLRSPVIGRKTWYGTHSPKGANTAAILFTIVESCKLNKVNPRTYIQQLVKNIHQKKSPYTPYQAATDKIFTSSS
jgi:transposase